MAVEHSKMALALNPTGFDERKLSELEWLHPGPAT